MIDQSFACCKTLKCVDSFVLGKWDVAVLRAEQANISRLSTCSERLAWVKGQVPVINLAKNKGLMMAAGQYVCNKFFFKAFGVVGNVVESAKRNPGAPISNRYLFFYFFR